MSHSFSSPLARRHLHRAARSRGMTLVETAVSVGIFAFIIGFVGFLIFMSSINAYNLHDQVMAQTAASNACETLAATLRQASNFALYDGDVNTTPTRVKFAMPPQGSSSAPTKVSVVCWDPGNLTATPPQQPRLLYFENENDVEFTGGRPQPKRTPTRIYYNIKKFEVMFESDFRVQLTLGYEYRGFAFMFKKPEVPQLGQFTTDIIARNHYLHYGPNGYTDFFDHVETTTPIAL